MNMSDFSLKYYQNAYLKEYESTVVSCEENKGLFDIKINTKYNITQLKLKKGPYKGQEYYDFNEKLRLYCIKNLIYMWK